MRLARRALVAALATLMLCVAASAQTLRPEQDPRNTAPTIGTGGPVGGPTGLFTIYDGQTLRRGEFTFSFAYSNYDRDPGNVDLTDILGSFQVGISDRFEIFADSTYYRGIKVNNPQNLSSFYLPNSQLRIGGRLQSGGAIVLAPTGPNVGPIANFREVFRPVGSQPFVQFPFIGGTAGNFGLAPGTPGGTFGFPGFNAQLGPARQTGDDGNFITGRYQGADTFPGIGSTYGSILPGIVLNTGAVTGAPGGQPTVTGPRTFTTAPTYLPDAPFINRLYGTSSFSNITIGGKIRFTGPNNAFGIGVIPFYRFYLDKADDQSGFNQLQRGASPGSNFGDIGAIMFFDGRLSRSVNLSANFGFIANSNVESEALGDAVLLDRPNELILGVGFDFPVNRYFQPILELRSTQYVGGRTPNAFENSPIEGLAGIRVYPTRYMGFSAAYRRHLNPHETGSFQGTLPTGFIESDDPNGFLAQFFVGRRNERAPEFLPNQPPTVTISAAQTAITLPAQCGTGERPVETVTPSTSLQVPLTSQATDPDGDTLLYTYTVTPGGRISGEGANATLDLTGVEPGTYTATVEVDDGCGCIAFSSTAVNVTRQPCEKIPIPCPTITLDCPTGIVPAGQSVTLTANAAFSPQPEQVPTLTYNWTVSAGNITSGQGTNSIQVDTTGLGGQTINATVTAGGLDATCANNSATCSVQIAEPPKATKFDEYGNVRFNDEKARLDNFAIQLQNDPTAQGYIIAYGGRRGTRTGAAQARADRAKDYLVNTRGVDAGRIQTLDGGFREEFTVELYTVQQGATPPAASNTIDASEVQTAPEPRRRRPRRGRRR
ncbi:MAG: hypothetical protein H0T92_04240 [Pyrinomonadaceae bacterium]|nr:hypothetical protein [Pyrinomonadaceae bacterium]